MLGMRASLVVIVALVAGCVEPQPPATGPIGSAAAKCVAVHDGDTVTVRWTDGTTRRIRLEGVDAPELAQAHGRVAHRFLNQLLEGRSVFVIAKETDVHGRLVARVSTATTDSSVALIEAGHAWHFTRFSSDAELAAAERAARAARRGLWSDPEPTPPWAFREQGRAGRSSRAGVGGPYHGNESSLIYHARGCEHFDCRRCTVPLESADDARERGFRPHRRCVEGPDRSR